MHDIALVPTGAPGWCWSQNGVPGANDWSKPSFSERQWRIGTTPFLWDVDFQLDSLHGSKSTSDAAAHRVLFRHRFDRRMKISSTRRHRLLITSQSPSVEAYLNGKRIELTQDAAQKKRGLFAAVFEDNALTKTENVLAVAVAPPKDFGAVVLDARIDTLASESLTVEEKLVTERAVVCDQCSSLSGDRHACVYACPHEAALRINAWADFPETVN
jgi:hypothetical protein